MNPANYQNLAAPGMMPQGLAQQGAMQRSNASQNASQQIQHVIIRSLQQEQQQNPPLQGWQANVPIMPRAMQIFQLVSSLRLIKPDIEIQQSINLAAIFESKVFQTSPDKDSYERACKEKLAEIQETRARQATSLQQHMQNSQPPLMNMTQQQMQMQGMVQNQSQAQFQQGFGGPQMQQRMQVPAMVMQQPSVQMGNPQMNMPQMTQNAHPQMPPPQFSVEENTIITQLAQQIAQNMPRERIDAIRNGMQNLSPEQRQIFQMQNMDPMAFYFRSQAIKRYTEQRARINAQRMNQSIAPPGNALMPPQVRPASQNSGPPQGQQPTPQMFDPPFVVDHIVGQQQDAMRSQEAGHVVVPASNSQGIADQHRGNVRGTPQQQPNPIQGGNHPTHQQPATQYWPNSHPNMQQNPTMQVPLQTSNFGNMSQQHPLQGQIGGLNNHAGRLAQNPAMPNLNKGLGTSPQTPNMWTPQRVAQPNQPKDQVAPGSRQGTQQQGVALPKQPEANQQRQRPTFNLASLTPQQQQQLASLSQEQKQRLILTNQQLQRQQQVQQQQQQQQQQSERVSKGPDSEPMQAQKSQNAAAMGQQAPQPVTNNAVVNNGSQQTPVSQPPVPTVAPGQQNLQPQRTPQQPQQLNMHQNARAAVQQVANYTLNEEQARQMDSINFPSGILNATNAYSQIPENVKTWAQLKLWVSQNDSILPPGSLGKLRGLQGLHFQNIAQQQKRQNVNMGSSHPIMAPGSTQPLAPTAPMVPLRNNGLTMSVTNPPRPGPNVMQPIPQPTMQEIQAARTRLPERLAHMTDHQIATVIMRQRHEEIMKASHAQQKPGQQQIQYNNLQRPQYPQGVQQQFPPPPNQPAQAPQPSTVQRPTPPQNSRAAAPSNDAATKQQAQPSRMSQTPNQGQPGSKGQPGLKGVKRNSSDDVFEVPNPNVVHQDGHSKPQVSTQPRSQAPPNNSDQFPAAPMDQKAALEAQRRMQATQRAALQSHPSINGLNTEQQRAAEQVKRDIQLKQIMAEVNQTFPARPSVSMDARTKEKMIAKLRDAKDTLQRLDQSLPLFFKMFADEPNITQQIKIVYAKRLMLQRQYRDLPNFVPADQFSISPEELDVSIDWLRKYFDHIKQKLVQLNAPPSGPQPLIPPHQRAKPIEHVLREQTPYLSVTNLQQHDKAMQDIRQASVQKTHNTNRVPAAPTSPQPPFTFGAQSPQGLAKYPDKPNGLTQDKLALPSKRRKGNPPSAGSPPVPPPGTIPSKTPHVAKNIAQGTRPATPPIIMIKCPISNCQANSQGFATQTELDRHTSETHEPKEPLIEDPLQWACDQLRFGLGLDESGKSAPRKVEVPAEKEVHEAPKMKASTSSQSQSAVKQEASTPMTRVPTQTGPSPASNLLKTPQASANVKTPASEVKYSSKEGKSVESKPSTDTAKREPSSSPDPWATSLVSPAVITQAWSGLSELQSLGSWTKIENTLTPASTLSSGKSDKNSPRVSDISENDAVKINLAVDNDKDWIPSDWFEDVLYGDMEALTMDQDMLAMDWETAFGADFAVGSGENGVSGGKAGALTVDDVQPSPDWLEIYASEGMDQTF